MDATETVTGASHLSARRPMSLAMPEAPPMARSSAISVPMPNDVPHLGRPGATLRQGLLAASMLLPIAVTDTGWSTPAAAETANAAENGHPTAPLAVTMTPATAPVPNLSAASNVPPAATAVTVLVQRAQFWLDQFAPDKAVDALNRAMQLDPHNPDVFAVLAQLQADTGNRTAATAALAQLRQLRPDDVRIAKIEQAIRTGVISPEDLQRARDLGQQNRNADAVAAYQRMFKGSPPPDRLAIEYYQTLAGVPGGWEQARAGLGQLVIDAPGNLKAQLAYAELLTYQEPSRPEGIERLMQLVGNSTVGAQADEALHQAMLWLPEDMSSVPALQAFLQTHPNAADVAQRLADAQAQQNATDPVGQARQAAFDALNANHLDVATQIFESVLNTSPNDPDALGGLGIVRLRQGRRDDARTLLSQAIQADPEHRDRWDQALQGATAVVGGSGANLSGQYAQVRMLADRGDYAQAEQLLNRITKGRGNPGMSLMLGDVQARAGHLPEAEASYRTALRGQPGNAMALIGLADVLLKQGHTAEADELFARAEASGSKTLVARARAEELRQRAQLVSDPSTAASMYRAANAADPANAWIRLEFARSLVKVGQAREAHSLMLDGAQRGGGDNLKAALIYAQEQNDGPAAEALLARIPARNRSAELRQFAEQAKIQSDIEAAAALYRVNPAAARQRLLAMAATPDPTGNRTALVVHALQQAGDAAAARQAINTAVASNPRPSPNARLAFAGTLLAVGETAQASTMVADADANRLTPDQQTAAQGIRTGIAVRSADQLNERGRQADAFDKLAPVLAQHPDDTEANLALARLYQGADKPRQALEIGLTLLRQDPNNLDVRRQAVTAAIAANDFRTAERLAGEATQGQPNEIKSWLISAAVAKARGDTSRAVQDLETARNLRRQQVGSSSSLDLATRRGRSNVLGAGHPHVELTQSSGTSSIATSGTSSIGTSSTGTSSTGTSSSGTSSSAPSATDPGYAPAAAIAAASPAAGPAVAAEPAATTAPAAAPERQARQTGSSTSDTSAGSQDGPADLAGLTSPASEPPQVAISAVTTDSFGSTSQTPSGRAAPGPTNLLPPAVQVAAPMSSTQPVASSQPGLPTSVAGAPAPAANAASSAWSAPTSSTATATRPSAADASPPMQLVVTPDPNAAPLAPAQPARTATANDSAPHPAALASPSGGSSAVNGRRMMAAATPLTPYSVPPASANSSAGDDYSSQNVAQNVAQSGDLTNPFRRPNMAVSPGQPYITNGEGTADPMVADIDRQIADLQAQAAPQFQAGFALRTRSGTAGEDKLTELMAPIEATFSPGGGPGVIKLQATPTYLSSGKATAPYALNVVGTNPLYAANGGTQPSLNHTQANGVGLDAAFLWHWVSADVGSTPIGFERQNVIGGVEIAPPIGTDSRFRLTLERRAVTDSVLSYSGVVDPRTGAVYGAVTRTRGHGQVETSSGKLSLYAGAGYSVYQGDNVQTNHEVEAGAGGAYQVYKTANDQVTVGLDLVYFTYDHDLRYFSFGQGGYYSPQRYLAALVPVNYTGTYDNLTYTLGGSAGYQTSKENASNVFPTNAALQAQLAGQPSTTGSVSPSYAGRNSSGFAGGAHGSIDYRIATNLHVGANASVQQAGDWTEFNGLVYARYIFDGAP